MNARPYLALAHASSDEPTAKYGAARPVGRREGDTSVMSMIQFRMTVKELAGLRDWSADFSHKGSSGVEVTQFSAWIFGIRSCTAPTPELALEALRGAIEADRTGREEQSQNSSTIEIELDWMSAA